MNIAGFRWSPDRHLWMVYPLAFVAVLIANGALVYFALSTWPGLAYDNAYERGRKYNQVLREEDRENALGWKVETHREGDRVTVRVIDAEARAITDLDVTAILVRPVGGTPNRVYKFGSVAPGTYTGEIELPMPGQWELRVVAANAAGDRAHEFVRFFVR
jgi:nitrogen fixation protein FixH